MAADRSESEGWTGRRWLAIAVALAMGAATGGCSSGEAQRVPPRVHVAPYDTRAGDVLWGVVPLRNESGTSVADTLAVSDHLVAAAERIEGVRTVPLNRTIAAMRSLGMDSLRTPEDARELAGEMGVDGLIVGSVTSWDPYDPPTVGLALALYARPGAMDRRGLARLDTRELTYQPTDWRYFTGESAPGGPASVASDVLDGKNHRLLMDLDRYVEGRSDPTDVLGSRRYLASMDLFTEFAAWRMVGRLVEHEWLRLSDVPRSAGASAR